MRATLVTVILRLLSLLPLPVAHALGAGLGWLLYAARSQLRHVSLINLALCLPELGPTERLRLTRRSLMEAGKTFAEMGALWFWRPERVRALVREISGEEVLQEALQQGRGVIVLTPHLGAWEMVNLHLGEKYPLTCLYRPPRLQKLHDMIHAARQRMGARLVPTTPSGVKALYNALARREFIGVLPDQDAGSKSGVFAPFFGVPASTMVLIPRLLHKTGAAVVYIYTERLRRGRGYHLHFQRAPDGIHDPDVAVSAAALNHGVEACVRELPEQYQWNYKRFKTRPAGGPQRY